MNITQAKKGLAVFLLLIGLSAVAGGIALLTNSAGIPISDLTGTIFSSYVWPGLLLAVAVGGTHIVGAILLLRAHAYEMESVAVAGFGLLIWMFVEVCMVGYHSWLQAAYFICAVCTLISLMCLLKYDRTAGRA